MFKKEINFISDLNLNKLQALGDRYTIEDVKKSKLHPAIFHFVQAAIDKEIFSDRIKIENDSIFDYNSDRINNYTKLISEEIKRTQRFDSKLIKKVVQEAIVFNTHYLSKPNNTLVNKVFGSSEVKTVEEIIVGLSHAYYYRYLQKILFTYLEKKQVLLMTKDEFKSLLIRIDSISKETHLEETIITAVNSIADFFDPNSNFSSKIPLEAIKLYLEEKNLTEFLSKIDYKFGKDSAALFLANDVLAELKSVTPESEIVISEVIQVEEELETDNSDSNQVLENENLLEIDSEEIEIPNNELLSEDNTITEIDEIVTEDNVGDVELEETKNKEENITSPEKKKNLKSSEVINKLVDLDSIYNSLLPSLKPFALNTENLVKIDFAHKLSDEIDYQLNLKTIREELPNSLPIIISENENNLHSAEDDNSIDYGEEENVEEALNRNDIILEENIVSDIAENTKVEINEPIEEVSNIEIVENVHENESDHVNTMQINVDDNQELDEIVNENEINIKDEDLAEITEVFTDLAFLDGQELEESIKINNDNSEIENKATMEEQNSEEYKIYIPSDATNFDSFSEMLSSKDMSKIIEYVFDYDMEDYHEIIDQISQFSNESEAIHFTEKYCDNNHIELAATEVDTFKSFISEYFTKTYS